MLLWGDVERRKSTAINQVRSLWWECGMITPASVTTTKTSSRAPPQAITRAWKRLASHIVDSWCAVCRRRCLVLCATTLPRYRMVTRCNTRAKWVTQLMLCGMHSPNGQWVVQFGFFGGGAVGTPGTCHNSSCAYTLTCPSTYLSVEEDGKPHCCFLVCGVA